MTGTNPLATAALVLHALSAVVWVGGMFFAHQVLRPAAAALDPSPRLLLWSHVLGRFFAWVIAAIVLLLASGYVLVFAVFGGFGKVGLHVHLMQGIGILMMLFFFHLYFAPWRRFSPSGRAGRLGRGRPPARPDPHYRDDQPGARPDRRRDRQQRPLLGLRPIALRCDGRNAAGRGGANRLPSRSCRRARSRLHSVRHPRAAGSAE